VNLRHIVGQAAAPDVRRADPQLAQPAGERFSCHGADSSTRGVRANGVRTGSPQNAAALASA